MDHLNPPHGGELTELLLSPAAAAEVKAASIDFPSITLSLRAQCDLELLLNGAFSPLRGFMGQRDYDAVLREMRLADNTLWPIPITLSVTPQQAEQLAVGQTLALREPEGTMLAALRVEDLWEPERKAEAELVYGTQDVTHPAVKPLLQGEERVYIGGPLQGLQLPPHYDFTQHRYTPAELRREFARRGWRSVAAFQTRNPLHRAHKEMTVRAASEAGAHLLLNPVVGMTKPGDIDHYTRVRCYEAIAQHYPPEMMMLALLNLAMRMGGPREAMLHAIIRKNHGCSHLIVGRDHAGPGNDSQGRPFYGPYAAQEVVAQHEEELGIKMIPFQEMVYVRARAQYMPINEAPPGEEVLTVSGTELRRRLREGLEIPEWFSYPNVVAELRRAYPGKAQQGITIFFTGLSGSGKSTVANVLLSKFLEIGGRPVTLLDGDIVRQNLSSELGFSREHRDLNILRIGFVAGEITKNRGIAICAPIAPYTATRNKVRELISAWGAFVEVHMATPLEVCEARDRKGLYAKARAGLLAEFTGISDPYEAPEHPEIKLDTSNIAPDEAAQEILLYLEREGYLA